MKHCTKCQTLKSAADFPKDRRLKSGLSSQCRACHAIRVKRHYVANKDSINERSRQWVLNHPERSRQLQRDALARRVKISPKEWSARREACKLQKDIELIWSRGVRLRKIRGKTCPVVHAERNCETRKRKVCTKCCQSKPCNDFGPDRRRPLGLLARCRECMRTFHDWNKRNRLVLRERAKQRYANETPDQRKLRLARTKRTKARRRSILKNIRRELTAEQWEQIKVIYKHRCAECRQKKFLTQDHIVPLSKGGEHIASNIRPLCGSCNSSKGARPASRQYQPYLLQ
jgi:hypothetical protein